MSSTEHEAPLFAEGYGRPIEKRTGFSIAPGIYPPSIGGFWRSDRVANDDTGSAYLTGGLAELAALTLSIRA
jgi:hypothetical protein